MKSHATLFQLGSDWQHAQTLDAKAPTSRHTQEEESGSTAYYVDHQGEKNCGDNVVTGPWTHTNENKDHFTHRDGKVFAGTHLIVDLWGAERLDDLVLMEKTMRECVVAAKATLLHIHLHHFTPNGGISGVAVLAESHISVHTWPERNYAAFDVFMCGDAKPEECIAILQKAFSARETKVSEIMRGEVTA